MRNVTIEIGSGNEPAPITLAEFRPQVLERFSEMLQCELKPDDSLDLDLRTVAMSYEAQKNDTNKTARAAKRSRQRKAANAIQKALEAINQLQTGDVVPFVVEGGDKAYDKFRALTRLLEHWSPVMDRVAERKLPRAREENDLLTNTCGWLKSIYEESSGEIATHNTMSEGIDVGQPLSNFGLFVVTFFEHADPSISPADLRESLARVVWPSRKE
jgi:hypothetical protein